MQDFLRRIPLTAKLLIIVIVPLIFISYLSLKLYTERANNLSEIRNYLLRINESAAISRLIDALQQERKFSFDYALTRDHQRQMNSVRPKTDSLLTVLKQTDDPWLQEFPSYTFLDNIDSVRMRIDRSHYDPNQVMHFYSSAIFRLNTLNKVPTLTFGALKATNRKMIAQRLLSELTTYYGIISANVYNVLYTKKFMVETLMGTYPTWDVYKTYQKELLVKANGEVQQQFRSMMTAGPFSKTDRYLDGLFATFTFDSSYSYNEWYRVSGQAHNQLRKIQLSLLDQAQKEINVYYENELHEKKAALVYGILLIAILAFLLFSILTVINRSLGRLKKAAEKLSKGDTDIHLPIMTNDAIGSLADSIQDIADSNRRLAAASVQIGEGNFFVPVQPRSDRDLLGNAVIKMQENLLRHTNDLRNSKEEFETLANLMPQIVWVSGAQQELNYYNTKWLQLIGRDENISKESWLKVIHPDDAQESRTLWCEAQKNSTAFETEYRLKDNNTGQYRWFLARAIPIVDDNGHVVKWFGTATDIHEQKENEQKLEQLVRERTAELERSNQDLQQFAHVASHDMKEPLRKISTFAERLREELGDAVPEKARFYINKMEDAATRMSMMIDGILNYSVVNSSRDDDHPVNLNKVLATINTDLELLISRKNGKLEYANLPVIKGSQTLVFQLFYNLISNSFKFSRDHVPPVVKVSAKTVSGEAARAICEQASGNYWQISVEDNGIGFSQEYAGAIFEPFTRLNGKHEFEGTGLGLALCKKIAERHEGFITAQSAEGSGSVFHVLIPAGEKSST